jgi:hypothetical protein
MTSTSSQTSTPTGATGGNGFVAIANGSNGGGPSVAKPQVNDTTTGGEV